MKSILTFGRGKMDGMTFFLGHIILLGSAVCIIIVLEEVGLEVAALFCFLGGIFCFFTYSFIAMRWRFMDIGWNPNWVGWVWFPTLGQILWLVLFFVCILAPGTLDESTD